jgi:hypothetical protein
MKRCEFDEEKEDEFVPDEPSQSQHGQQRVGVSIRDGPTGTIPEGLDGDCRGSRN